MNRRPNAELDEHSACALQVRHEETDASGKKTVRVTTKPAPTNADAFVAKAKKKAPANTESSDILKAILMSDKLNREAAERRQQEQERKRLLVSKWEQLDEADQNAIRREVLQDCTDFVRRKIEQSEFTDSLVMLACLNRLEQQRKAAARVDVGVLVLVGMGMVRHVLALVLVVMQP